MSNKEKLRELIVKACPELIKLTNGCKFVLSKGTNKHRYTWCDNEWYEDDGLVMMKDFEDAYDETWKLEITGHEPHLEHLMRAIKKSKDIHKYPMIVGIDSNGELLKDHSCQMGESDKSDIVLDLTKPTLDQSEEVISKLIEILK